MKSRRELLVLAFLIFGSVLVFGQGIVGLWKQLDDKTGKPQSIVCIYGYQGKLYGRIIAGYDDKTGKIRDTIYLKKDKADKLVGDPPFCGLDFVYDVVEKDKDFRGEIMDPRNGDEFESHHQAKWSSTRRAGPAQGTAGFPWQKPDMGRDDELRSRFAGGFRHARSFRLRAFAAPEKIGIRDSDDHEFTAGRRSPSRDRVSLFRPGNPPEND